MLGLNNILFIIRYIHAYIQTIHLTIGSDGKHSAYMKVISCFVLEQCSRNEHCSATAVARGGMGEGGGGGSRNEHCSATVVARGGGGVYSCFTNTVFKFQMSQLR